MKLYQYDYILAVAEERSFTKAAKKLYIAQPSLSQYVTSVEKELGVELFDRGSTPISLTYAGQLFVDTAAQIISLQNQLKVQISDLTRLKTGHLTVGMTPFRSTCILPSVLTRFKQRWPDVKVDLLTGTITELSGFAQEGKLDIFITIESDLNKNLFDFEFLTVEKVLLAVPNESPVNGALKEYQLPLENIMDNRLSPGEVKRVPLSRLKDELFLFSEPPRNLYGLSMELCKRAGFEPHILLTNWNIDSIFGMTIAGLGISFMPFSYIKYGNIARHAVYYCIDDDMAERNVVFAYKKKLYLSNALKEFISIMRSFLR